MTAEVISDKENIAKMFNNFFVNILPNSNIPTKMDFEKTDDPVLNAISKYKYHSSTVIINSKIDPASIFSFTPEHEDIWRCS